MTENNRNSSQLRRSETIKKKTSNQPKERHIDKAFYISIEQAQPLNDESSQLLSAETQEIKIVKQKGKPNKTQHEQHHIIEVSDVDANPQISQTDILKLRLNTESLFQTIQYILQTVKRNEELVADLSLQIQSKPSESALADYLQRIKKAIPKEIVEHLHKNKLKDAEFFIEDAADPQMQYFRKTVDEVVERVEALILTILNQKQKIKAHSTHLTKIEDCYMQFMTVTQCREHFQQIEERLVGKIEERIGKINTDLHQQHERLVDLKEEFGSQVKHIKNECLWRIKDAEELIKSRVSQVSLDQQIKDFKVLFMSDLKSRTDAMSQKVDSAVETTGKKMNQLNLLSGDRYQDFKQLLEDQDIKLRSLASRDQVGHLETTFTQRVLKLEEELDQFQYSVRDLTIKLNDCQTKLTKNEASSIIEFKQQVSGLPPDSELSQVSQKVQKICDEIKSIKSQISVDIVNNSKLERVIQQTKNEFKFQLPDMSDFETKILNQVYKSRSEIEDSINPVLKSIDSRLLILKTEINIDQFRALLSKKADLDSTVSQLKVNTENIESCTKNFQNLKTAIKEIQNMLTRNNLFITELQEANKDILVGKRKLDCLSCGEFDYHTTTTAKTLKKSIEQANSVKILSNHSNQQNILSANKHTSSDSRNNQQTQGSIDIHNSYVNNFFASSVSRQYRILSSDKNSQSYNNIQSRKKKLPISFMVQQEKKRPVQSNISDSLQQFQQQQRPDSAIVVMKGESRLRQLERELGELS